MSNIPLDIRIINRSLNLVVQNIENNIDELKEVSICLSKSISINS